MKYRSVASSLVVLLASCSIRVYVTKECIVFDVTFSYGITLRVFRLEWAKHEIYFWELYLPLIDKEINSIVILHYTGVNS